MFPRRWSAGVRPLPCVIVVACAGGPAAPSAVLAAPAPTPPDTAWEAVLTDTASTLVTSDSGCATVRVYLDADGDGHGDAASYQDACAPEIGWSAVGDDCDDGSAVVFPGAPELCDGRDNDCDGADAGTCEAFATEGAGTWEGGGLMTEAIPDVTGDGIVDFAVLATYSRAYVVPGPMLGTGRTAEVAVFSVEAGYSLNNGAGAGDVTGDGIGDLWYGSFLLAGPVAGKYASELELAAVAVGDFASSGPLTVEKNDLFGLPDVTGDGVPDALVPYRWREEYVHLIDGPFLVDEDPYETALLTVIDDFDEYGGDDAGNDWGNWMHEAGDTDGDGVAELIVMDVREGFPGAWNDNYLYLVPTSLRGSVATEDLLFLETEYAPGAFGAGDVDADGYSDLLIPNDCGRGPVLTVDGDGCVVFGPVVPEGGMDAQRRVELFTPESSNSLGQVSIGTAVGDVPPQLKRDSPYRRHRSGTRRARDQQAPPIVQRRPEGRLPSAAPRRQGPRLPALRGERPPAEPFLLLAATALRERRQRPPVARRWRPVQGTGGQGRGPREAGREEGRGHRLGHRGARQAKKNTWGGLNGRAWVQPDVRDAVVDFTREWSERTEIPVDRFIAWIGMQRGKFYAWKQRYGKANEHNGHIPRDHWLTPIERQAILDFQDAHPLDGYRRITYMMIDADLVAASPSTVHRVLRAAGRLDRWTQKPSRKGTGFDQPLQPHQHWHIDISYLNVAGTFYYLCSILDGCSRFIIHWQIREAMKEPDIERLVERARELHPGVSPRIISDNGPQFIAGDFKNYIRLTGMTHVRTSPYYPQSNGKIERWHKTLKANAIRIKPPSTREEAHRVVAGFVEHYNTRRLHSAISYVTPADRLAGRHTAITAERDRRLEAARERRAAWRQAARCAPAASTANHDPPACRS